MNPRERTLLIALVAVVGLGAVGYGFKRFFWDPLQEYNGAIATLNNDNDKLAEQLKTFFDDRKKLTFARMRSLPNEPAEAAAEYTAYLQPLLTHCGLVVDEFSHAQAQKVKVVTPIPTVKEVGHVTIPFTVSMRGDLSQIVKALAEMQKAPYEHRIKMLTIDRVDLSSKKDAKPLLNVRMTVETMIVGGTTNKPGLVPGVDPRYLLYDTVAARTGIGPGGWGVLASALSVQQSVPVVEGRDYARIAEKNIFVGAIPLPPVQPPPDKTKKEPKTEPEERPPPEFTPKYVYLTHTLPETQEFYFRNRIYEGPEIHLYAKKKGWDVFRIADEFGNYTFFKAKVLKVELRQVYFQVKRDVYKIHIGENLADAMEAPIDEFWVDLEDRGLFDREWADAEAPKKGKEDNKGKTAKKKGGR
jgi:hypothetical protein